MFTVLGKVKDEYMCVVHWSAPSKTLGAGHIGRHTTPQRLLARNTVQFGLDMSSPITVACRQPGCLLSGRFLPPYDLELPPQLMERLLLDPSVLACICLHQHSRQSLPAHVAAALADYYGSRWVDVHSYCC